MPTPSTVADLLLRQAEVAATGVLTVTRGQVKKQIFLRDGAVVSAESNLREEALGELLVALGLLDKSRLWTLLTEVKRRREKMGAVLLELGWVTADDVLSALAEQVRRRTISCLRWTADEASFAPSTDFVGHLIEHPFETAAMIFRGLRETTSFDLLLPYLEPADARLCELDPRFDRHREAYLHAFGPEVPTLLANATKLGSLASRPEAMILLEGIEALLASGLATLAAGAHTETNVPGAVMDAAAATDSETLLVGLWDPPGVPSDIPGNGPPTDALALASGTHPGGFGGSAAAEAPLPADLMREYLQMHDRLPHDVLGVPEHALPAEVDAAYQKKRSRVEALLAKDERDPHRAKLDELLAAYARAWSTLANPTLPGVERHVAGVPLQALAPTMDPLGAELAFNEGRALLARSRAGDALSEFRVAVERRPDQAAYHAWLGWTLFQVERRAALPEARDRLEHAVALDPDSVDGHGLLGSLLADLGERQGARMHLERTLALRPEQPDHISRLLHLYDQEGQPEQAEKMCRRLVGALGDREPALRSLILRELGDIYEGPLGDFESAARSYAAAARLTPTDVDLRQRAEQAARRAHAASVS